MDKLLHIGSGFLAAFAVLVAAHFLGAVLAAILLAALLGFAREFTQAQVKATGKMMGFSKEILRSVNWREVGQWALGGLAGGLIVWVAL